MTPLGARVRASLAVLAAAAMTASTSLVAVAAGPQTALDASSLAVGSITADAVVGDFTIKATAAKNVTVDASDRTSDRGDVYTQRIKLNGAGAATNRALAFTVDAAAEVLVHTRSGSTADRALTLYDATGTAVDSVPALADDGDLPIATEYLSAPAAGTYFIASPASGVNVYYAEITDGSTVDRAPWSGVEAPVVDGVAVDAGDPSRLVVSYTGVLGTDGGDVARAVLYDADGTVVDRGFTATDGPRGTIALTPPGSGTYEVAVQLTRSGEADALTSERVTTGAFALPLVGPQSSGALTSAITAGRATVTVSWAAVPEAETYTVQTSAAGTDYVDAVEGVTGTTADVAGLVPGATYQVRVVAHRGDDEAAGAPFEVAVAAEVQRWATTEVGSNANSGGAVTDNGDGTITFDAKASSTKLATSEDGFQYFYTKVDPTTENFTLDATFRVDDASTKDNQSGFGILAVDSIVPGDATHRYFNSAGALITRYGEGTPSVLDGTPGARFVQGYTGSTDDATAGTRDSSDSQPFDPTYRADTAGPKFATGDVYQLTLRRSNTGFHAIWHRGGGDGGDAEVIEYDPDMLLAQDADAFYVGMVAARKIVVTVTDWSFTTIAPEDDEPAQEPPTTYIPAELRVDVTSTTPEDSIDVPLVSTMYGTGQILAADGTVVVDDVALAPGERTLVPLALKAGDNSFTARLLPAAEQPQLDEDEAIESTDPVDVPLSFTVRSYGKPGQSIQVAPDGSPQGDGSPQAPLDLHTAVDFAQAGQQIILAGGTYRPTSGIVVERGRDGTEQAPITLMSAPGTRAVLDLSQSSSGGLRLRGDWWHVYDLEITRSGDKQKPMLIEGHHNVVERVESHHNLDTGVQISGSSNEPPAMWPSDNLVVSSVSHDNADPGGNDADGFAAKLTVGEGNVFRSNISHHNIDDGWDLYAKSTTGPIGTVVVEDSVAYDNGRLSGDDPRTGEGNGFKLGGESMPGDHLLRNSISYGNLGTGVTSNSGPDVRLQRVTSADNDRGVRLETNAGVTNYRASGVLSFRNPQKDVLGLKQADTSLLADPSNYVDGATADTADGRPAQVSEAWFVSTDASTAPEIAADGSVEMHGLYELTALAPADTGARLTANEHPTQITPLPPISTTPVLENVVAPTVVGHAVKGATLTADPGTWSIDATFTYRWLRDGKPIGTKGTAATYKVVNADAGHTLSVQVTAVAAGSDPVVAVSPGVVVHDRCSWIEEALAQLIELLKRLIGRP